MGASIEDLLSDSTPSSTPSTSPDPAPETPVAEAQAPSEPVAAPAPSAEGEQVAPVVPAEPKVETQTGTGKTNDGPPPSGDEIKEDDDPRKVAAAFKRKSEDEARKRQEAQKQIKERDERLAAQEAELTELRELRARQSAPPQRQAQRPVQPQRPAQPRARMPDPDVDPGQAIRMVDANARQAAEHLSHTFEERLMQQSITHSQALARMRHADYDAVETIFADEADKNPVLYQQMRASPDPAQFAYEVGQKIKGYQEIGSDPLAWATKKEQEIRERLEADYAARQVPAAPRAVVAAPQAPAPAPSPPPSLVGVTSAQPRNAAPVYAGPTPLSKILA